jgi:hypothetical protein
MAQRTQRGRSITVRTNGKRWYVPLLAAGLTAAAALIASFGVVACNDRNRIFQQVIETTQQSQSNADKIDDLKIIAKDLALTNEAIRKEMKAIRLGLAAKGITVNVEPY